MTRLCVAIFVTSVEQAIADIARAAEAGADMVELRLDRFTDLPEIDAIIRRAGVPVILTCRSRAEGGQAIISDVERLQLLESASQTGTPYVDVEWATLQANPTHLAGKSVIASTHDFATRPDRLYSTLGEMNESPAEIVKTVWQARSIRDNIEAFEILESRAKPTIALCMGEAGLLSRVLAKKFGAFLTFAAVDHGGGTAPGQIAISDMKRLYRWDAIGKDTRVFGVVASPVKHSMSPAVHNAAFDATGYDGVYLPMLVEGSYESFKAFMETFIAFAPLHLRGLSITIPHKEHALKYLEQRRDQIDPLAKRSGAVNTITVSREHDRVRLVGTNTDYQAIIDTVCVGAGITQADLRGKRVAVIGAGGTGRTAVAAMAHCGTTVVVYNRTHDRAIMLAADFNGSPDATGQPAKVVAGPWAKLCGSCCDVFINTTSVGLHPNTDASPFGDDLPELTQDTLVFDTIYNPMHTKLLRDAKAAGAKTIGGVEMFVRQAAGQFKTWTGIEPPMDVMRRTIESRLSAVR